MQLRSMYMGGNKQAETKWKKTRKEWWKEKTNEKDLKKNKNKTKLLYASKRKKNVNEKQRNKDWNKMMEKNVKS